MCSFVTPSRKNYSSIVVKLGRLAEKYRLNYEIPCRYASYPQLKPWGATVENKFKA